MPVVGSIVPYHCAKASGHDGAHTAFLGGSGEPVFSWEDHPAGQGITGWAMSDAEQRRYLDRVQFEAKA